MTWPASGFADEINDAMYLTLTGDTWLGSGGTGGIATWEAFFPQPRGDIRPLMDTISASTSELPAILYHCEDGGAEKILCGEWGFNYDLHIWVVNGFKATTTGESGTTSGDMRISYNFNINARDRILYLVASKNGSAIWIASHYQVTVADNWSAGTPSVATEEFPYVWVSESVIRVTVRYPDP